MDTPSQLSTTYHRSVLLDETVRLLDPSPGRIIVDGTLGGGGHTEMLLKSGATVIGLDQDLEALNEVKGRLNWAMQGTNPQLTLVQSNFRDFAKVLDSLQIDKIDGLLLDLGVSSFQLDTPTRGFSFRFDGPLDMRMDQSGALSKTKAADLLANASREELLHIFRVYGEEPQASRVATAIIKARAVQPITTTAALASLVESVIYQPHFKKGKHPATRIFQALRIAVNDELGALNATLESTVNRLQSKGRLAIITFHSLEDRIVKTFGRETTAPTIDRPEWPQPKPNPRHFFRYLEGHKKPLEATPDEQASNPRARSAKLRVIEHL